MSGRPLEPLQAMPDRRRAELRVPSYQPDNWYWIVGGSVDQVYSSARAAYVPVSDPAYVAWLAGEEGRQPTKIAVEEDLFDVLRKQHPKGLPPDKIGTHAVDEAANRAWARWSLEELEKLGKLMVDQGVLSKERADQIFSLE